MNCELMFTYDTPAYMFNVHKNQQKLLRKMRRKISWDGRKDRGKTVYPHPVGRGYNKTSTNRVMKTRSLLKNTKHKIL
jgi:hypothetical protein